MTFTVARAAQRNRQASGRQVCLALPRIGCLVVVTCRPWAGCLERDWKETMMQLFRATALAAAAAATVLAVGACGSSRTVHHQHSFAFAGTRLVVDVDSSDLRLVPGTGPGIDVQRWLRGTAAGPGHASWTLHDGTLRLSVDCTGIVFHCGSAFQVAVPPGVAGARPPAAGHGPLPCRPPPVPLTGRNPVVHRHNTSWPLRLSAGPV